MRPVRITAVALIAASGLFLAGCGSDDNSSASDAGTSATPTPSDSSSAMMSETPSDGASDDSTMGSSEVGDFAEVDGYTLVALPKAASQAFGAAVNSTPQIQGFEGRMVEKDGEQVGMVIRISVDEQAAALPDFEKQFLPGFASGIAGSSAKPEFEEINGVNVVKIATPDGSGTAYAWLEGSVATVLVFKDAADAQAYAEGALN
ncbi:MAG: hypothetical protein ACJ73J_03310 [Actinomycetes bacterium]